jgi:hypothetical protein
LAAPEKWRLAYGVGAAADGIGIEAEGWYAGVAAAANLADSS